jgi:nucleoid DNA-binding protein
VNKTKFIERIAEEADVPKSEAQRYFEAVENVITSTLKEDQEVQITGFGTFYAREQKAREGVNPQIGEKMHIAARKVPAFSAGNGLKESI